MSMCANNMAMVMDCSVQIRNAELRKARQARKIHARQSDKLRIQELDNALTKANATIASLRSQLGQAFGSQVSCAQQVKSLEYAACRFVLHVSSWLVVLFATQHSGFALSSPSP